MFSIIRTLVVGGLAFVASAFLTFEIALLVSPTVTRSGHRVMALGHAFIAIAIGVLVAIAAMIADRVAQHRRSVAKFAALTELAESARPPAMARDASRSATL